MNKAIFLDRDGVINEDTGYIYRIEDYKFLPGTFAALRLAQLAGYKLIVVTNQAGIGKDKYSENDYNLLTNWILQQLRSQQINIAQIYHCPHHPQAVIEKYKQQCECRKPHPGMLLQAAWEHDLKLADSYLIGDKLSDILAGKNAGCKTILVKTGHAGADKEHDVTPDNTAENLLSAIKLILRM